MDAALKECGKPSFSLVEGVLLPLKGQALPKKVGSN